MCAICWQLARLVQLWRQVMLTLATFRRAINNSEVVADFVGFVKKHVHDELTGSAAWRSG